MQKILCSWQTTSAGILMICGAIVHLVFMSIHHTADESTWMQSITAILGGLAAIAAGDAAKSATTRDVNELKQNVVKAIENKDTTFITKPEVKPLTPT